MSETELVGHGFYLEDFPVGRKFKTLGRTVTETDVVAFIGVTGMVEVLFTNLEHLRHESAFSGKRLVPAALVYSFAEGLVMQSTLQGTGIAFLTMEFAVHSPTFVGDTMHVECEVLEARRTSKPGRGIVKTVNHVLRHDRAPLITYSPTRMIKARD